LKIQAGLDVIVSLVSGAEVMLFWRCVLVHLGRLVVLCGIPFSRRPERLCGSAAHPGL